MGPGRRRDDTARHIFWLFFILSTLQPIVKQRLLEAARQRLIGRIEAAAGLAASSSLVHRQETMSFLGVPAPPVHRHQTTPRNVSPGHPADGPGGPAGHRAPHARAGSSLGRAADRAPRSTSTGARVTVFVPHYRDCPAERSSRWRPTEIIMSEARRPRARSIPQIRTGIPAAIRDESRPARKADPGHRRRDGSSSSGPWPERRPSPSSAGARRSSSPKHQTPAKGGGAREPPRPRGTWTHDYPITSDEAKSLGLPVGTDMAGMSFFPAHEPLPAARPAHPGPSSTSRRRTGVRAPRKSPRPERKAMPRIVGHRPSEPRTR